MACKINGNFGGDILNLQKYHKTFLRKMVLEDHGGGGGVAGIPILHVRLHLMFRALVNISNKICINVGNCTFD